MSKVKTGLALAFIVGVLAGGVGLAAYQADTASAPQREERKTVAAVSGPEKLPARAPRGRDRFGDPLPKGAVARLGTVRFRHGWFLSI